MLISRGRQRGVTLIELMVGVSIVALIAMLAAPSFVTSMQNRRIRTSAESIRTGLQYAKAEAVRRNRAVNFALASDGGWQVGCTVPDTTIVNDEQLCPAQLQSRTGTESTTNAVVTSTQATSLSGTGSASAGLVQFTALGRVDPSTLPGGSLAIFSVTNPTGGTCAANGGEMRCLKVFVTSTGQIRMCDPAVASGDPRACS
jgi:type IV fimbrial biogenesis protein FimT